MPPVSPGAQMPPASPCEERGCPLRALVWSADAPCEPLRGARVHPVSPNRGSDGNFVWYWRDFGKHHGAPICYLLGLIAPMESTTARRFAIYKVSWPPRAPDLGLHRVGQVPARVEQPLPLECIDVGPQKGGG